MIRFTCDDLRTLLEQAFLAQDQNVGPWHRQEPDFPAAMPGQEAPIGFSELVQRLHWTNFRLWHLEDRARRRDAGPELIADCKYAYDQLNQERGDLIEALDALVVQELADSLPSPPEGARPRYNTDTIGAAVDRGSVLALKIYHMQEQTERAGVTAEHVDECRRKLAVLAEQRGDLLAALLDLVEDYAVGLKRPKVYFQYKMYNDPRLNPELYSRRSGA